MPPTLARSEEKLPLPPLAAQLEALELWAAALGAGLRTFKSGFKEAGGALLASADRQVCAGGGERRGGGREAGKVPCQCAVGLNGDCRGGLTHHGHIPLLIYSGVSAGCGGAAL